LHFCTIRRAKKSMPTGVSHIELPPAVRRILDAVRRRLRAYVWLEGLALVIVLLGAAFWLGLAVDWSFEPSPRLRQIGLVVLGLAALYVAYRYLLRRVAVPISDSTAAALLERRFPALNEHVLTAVDVTSSPDRAGLYHPDFVYQTQQSAAHAVAAVRAGELFNRGPLVRAIGSAAALTLSIGLFALVSRDAFAFWLERIALSDEPWPRRVHLEVVGFTADAGGQRVHKLAQDDDFELLVHAQAGEYEVPAEVEIRFRLADGRRGRDTMIRVGEAQPSHAVAGVSDPGYKPDPGRKPDEFQLFRYQFKRVAADMTFDVVGGDDRVRDLRLQVVDRPELFAIELECVYPDYLQREPRRLPVTGGMRIPEGARLVLHAGATKPLTAARIHRANDQSTVAGVSDPGYSQLQFSDQPRDELRWEYGILTNDDVLLVSVTDQDGVTSREPYRVSLAVVRDEVPQVAVRLAGIGAAITPEAVLPLVGKITDDYGLDRAWFEYQVDGEPISARPLAAQPGGESLLNKLDQFDLRTTDESTGKRALELKPGQRFALSLKASDRFDLSDEPRAGSSQQFMLDVVTASDLLALLERRELTLRQRYEAIYEKMADTRDLLGRVEFDETDAETADGSTDEVGAASRAALDDSGPPRQGGPTSAQRALARRRLRVSGSLQNVVQSADEIAGVAEAFDDLGDQLTNNRIDNPDLKSRLREQIAQPLHRIADARMPQLAAQLKLVEQHVEDAAAGAAELEKTLALADKILVEMRQVLDRMLELETYNEVVALLRDIITDQGEISRRTKERQKERLRSLFEE
jgi:hypothetical protein